MVWKDSSGCSPCPSGFICKGLSNPARPCPAGTYNPLVSAVFEDSCIDCPAGSYSGEGSISCTYCPAGFKCLVNNTVESCEPGTYSALAQMDCKPCPDGFVCESPDLPPQKCAPGYVANNESIICEPCRAGTYSFNNTCIACRNGTYSSKGSIVCTTCPDGHSCADKINPLKCLKGTYAASDQMTCEGCPLGHSCEVDGLSYPTRCSNGTYQNKVNKTSCYLCPADYSCINNIEEPVKCSDGMYSLLGMIECLVCPAGFSCLKINGVQTISACQMGWYSPESVNECINCTKGHFCPSTGLSTPYMCPSGWYADDVGFQQCRPCPKGHACYNAIDSPVECQAGFYSAFVGQTNCAVCPLGFYSVSNGSEQCLSCPTGHKCPFPDKPPQKCGEGQYQDKEAQSVCLTATTNSAVVDASKVPIQCSDKPGYFSNGTACILCYEGHFCPSSVIKPISCPLGTYANSKGSVLCELCPSGYYCFNATEDPKPCDEGSFSTAGSIFCQACPQGHYSTNASSSCVLCPSGSMCPMGKPPILCDAGTYSPLGDEICHTCIANSFSEAGSTFCIPCPIGFFCVNPSVLPIPCRKGTYWSNTDEISKCILCPFGYTCDDPLLPPVLCKLGTYSTGGNSTCLPCPEGMSCIDPSKIPVPCKDGTFSFNGIAYCSPCPAGRPCPSSSTSKSEICPLGTYSLNGESTCNTCPTGYMCPNPFISPVPCRFGEYTDEKVNQTICEKCPPGYECPHPEGKKVVCKPGSFSLGSSVSCTLCPAGYRCPNVNKRPELCRPGEFSLGGQLVCNLCPAGKACSSRSSNSSNDCPRGTYSYEGQAECSLCPDGFACETPFAYAASPCPKGSFSNSGTCKKCPAGWACPLTDGSSNIQCPFGSYTIGEAVSCIQCPAGKECPTTTSIPRDCKLGSFSTGSQMFCTLCPSGNYCPKVDNATIIPCAAGSYSVLGQGTCTQCPGGFSCPSQNEQLQLPCAKGWYSPLGVAECIQCEAGSYCPNSTTKGLPCDKSGYYSLPGSIACSPCPKGYYCKTKDQPPVLCLAGSYSDIASEKCNICSPGYICAEGSVTDKPSTGICPLGYYCENNNKIACPAGKYGSLQGAANLTQCIDCPPGYYCPEATAGYPTESIKCPPGHYCLRSTMTAFENPCPAGTYSNQLGNARLNQCKDCKAGFYCPSGDPTGDSLCPAGHYCPFKTTFGTQNKCPSGTYNEEQGSTSLASCKLCPAGAYCPEASDSPIPCNPGTYNPLQNQGDIKSCLDCISGMACPQRGLNYPSVHCMAGHFCPARSIFPNDTLNRCPDGTYTDLHNATSDADCIECPAGLACEAGTGGIQKQPQPCAAGHWCKKGTRHPKQFPCPAGSWSNLTNLQSETGCQECPKGWFCLEGAFSPSGICPTGHYCPSGTQYSTQFPCAKGTFSRRQGNTRWEVCEPCILGHFCPTGTSNPEPCPKGSYRDELNGESEDSCKPCTAGYKCEKDGTVNPVSCGLGSYSDRYATNCSVCKKGYYCILVSTSYEVMSTKFICPAGMHCPEGLSWQPYPAVNPCKEGYYCLKGNEDPDPRPCPIGTFNTFTNLKHEKDCQQCPAGYYCEPSGLSNPAGECPPGYFCPLGTGFKYLNPCPVGFYRNASAARSSMDCSVCIAGMYCDEPGLPFPKDCPQGSFCPTGSTIPQPCPSGYYGNSTHLRRSKDCTACEAGMYCAGVGKTAPTGECDAGFFCKGAAFTSAPSGGITGGLCPKGGYCSRGAKKASPCPIGKYNSDEGAKSPADCLDCKAGFYCAGTFNDGPTGPCDPGYYCNGNATGPNQHKTPEGHYSEKQASFPIPCPLGFFQSSPTMSKCDKCTKGSYCNKTGLAIPNSCLKGHYCPEGTSVPIPCPAGTYNDVISKGAIEDCKSCLPGKFCFGTGLVEVSGKCREGYYCQSKSPVSNPGNFTNGVYQDMDYGGICRKGHYCLEGTSYPTQYQCKPGTYNPLYGATNESFCLECIPGQYCLTAGLEKPTGNCSAGYYCKKGSQTPEPKDDKQGNICPIGSFCSVGSSEPKICPEGSYSNGTGFSECVKCPARYYCDDGKKLFDCPNGFYCEEGTSFLKKKPCPYGTFGSKGGLASLSECTPCPPGKFCAGLAITIFPTTNISGFCEAGYYCLEGISISKPSPPLSSGRGGLCPTGYFCPEGTGDYKATPCPAGTYSNIEGLKRSDECKPCSPGEYCEGGQSTTSGLCDAGYYCKRGASARNNSKEDETSGPCPIAHFCPVGTSEPQFCKPGTYMPQKGAEKCWSCPAGYFCPSNQSDYLSFPCPFGSFCPNGTQYATQYRCPAGTFGNMTRSVSVEDCTPCPGGFYCEGEGLTKPTGLCSGGYFCLLGAKTSKPNYEYSNCSLLGCTCSTNVTGGVCPSGFFCPSGIDTPLACPGGFYCETKGLLNYTGQCDEGYFCRQGSWTRRPTNEEFGDICPAGFYCPKQTQFPRPCPPGKYLNTRGNTKEEDCISCNAGYYCEGFNNTSVTGPCSEGYYCPAGQSSSKPVDFACPAGYFCKEGSISPELCEAGKWNPILRQFTCRLCPERYYCELQNSLSPLTDYSKYPCPEGYFCPNGTKYSKQFGCPPGTFSNKTKLASSDECIKCPAGKYCLGSSSTFSGYCDPGYYCIEGSKGPKPTNETGIICPQGKFCLKGTEIPFDCPIGTFNNGSGLQRSDQCTNCSCGMYCSMPGLTAPTGICDSRYFCKSRAEDSKGSNGTGGECILGHYCPPKSCEPLPCKDGSYMSDRLAESCLPCPSGFYCVGDHINPRLCPSGFYCEENTGFNWKPCPPGTFSNKEGLHNSSSCEPCPNGMYCPYFNATAPEGPCSAGYFCKVGSPSKAPLLNYPPTYGPCPAGSYCPMNTTNPIPCPRGRYSNYTHLKTFEDCSLCDPGYYCEGGQSHVSGECWEGFYCKLGSKFPNPPEITELSGPCPIGTFCPNGTSYPLGCPRGTFNDRRGQSKCEECCKGYFCLENSTKCEHLCPKGHYCPGNTKNPEDYPCPIGTYNNATGKSSIDDCILCDPGKYCPHSGAEKPFGSCSSGWYCSRGAWSPKPMDFINNTDQCFQLNISTGGMCKIGEFCAAGSSKPTVCPPGKYCEEDELSNYTGLCNPGYYCILGAKSKEPLDGVTGNICPQGKYCPIGSSSPTNCPYGTFSNSTGNKGVQDCLSCTSGWFCGSQGLIEPSGKCSEGFYCPGGQNTSRPSEYRCMPGHHCPIGSSNPHACFSGSYQNEFEQSACKECLAGFYCDGFVLNDTECLYGVQYPKSCPNGYYCLNGSITGRENACPEGTYNNRTGLRLESECEDCPAGKFCSGTGKSSWSGDCSAGYLCIGKATINKPVDGVTGVICSKGFYCEEGAPTMKACPPGKYNPFEGRQSANECLPCDLGKFCSDYNMSTTSGNCSDGYLCKGGSSSPKPTDTITGNPCPAGSFCQYGLLFPCPPGTYMNETHAKECYECPPGSFCVNRFIPEPCPPGFYCEKQTGYNKKPCPIGTYSKNVGLSSITECTQCNPGYYCSDINSTSPTGLCQAGFFCSNGSDSATPSGEKGVAGLCPAGSYCPYGSIYPIKCPIGTFNPHNYGKNLSDCRLCTGGQFCNGTGLLNPSGECDAGYFCEQGSIMKNPSITNVGYGLCPAGYYCPQGTVRPLKCAPGTYNNITGQASCFTCPAGFFCLGNEKYEECPKGHFCPENLTYGEQYPCPEGTFKNVTRGHSIDDCKMCTPGMFCRGTGLIEPSGFCSGGFYCLSGSWTDKPFGNETFNSSLSCKLGSIGGLCKKGTYCPIGSSKPISCDPGYYCDQDGLSIMSNICSSGYYCSGGSTEARPFQKVYGDICPPGYFCEAKSAAPLMCDKGFFAPGYGNKNVSDCIICSAGMYCDKMGLDKPSGNCSKGYYCPSGSVTSTEKICEPGYFCPEQSKKPIPCHPGYYQSNNGSEICEECPSGFYCLPEDLSKINNTRGAVKPNVCPKRFFCPKKTGFYNNYPCQIGFFGNESGLFTASQCHACTSGFFCDKEAQDSPTGICHSGFYCTLGAITPEPRNISEGGGPCRQGFYCEPGEQEKPCPKGTYGNRTQLKSKEECVSCDLGKFCNEIGLSSPSGECAEGYFCTGGAIESAPLSKPYGDICPAGHFCPSGTFQPQACPPGSFNNNTKSSKIDDCMPCSSGQYCLGPKNIQPTGKCEEGYYCIRGAYTPTPTWYSNITLNISDLFRCPIYSLNFTGGICPLGTYCPAGSDYPILCDPGMYCAKEKLGKVSGYCREGYFCDFKSTSSESAECRKGRYCPQGSPVEIECPAGTFNQYTRQFKQDHCQNCTPGFYCPEKGLWNATLKCAPGFYCPLGSTRKDSYECEVGSFCPEGAGKPTPCPSGFYQNRTGQKECIECPEGYSCDPISQKVHGVVIPEPCIPGHFCPKGTLKINQNPCPSGTYSNTTGNSQLNDCKKCDPGYYCSGQGNIFVTQKCDAGFVCFLGSNTSQPIDGIMGNLCPMGKYCIAGSSQGVDCPAGTFGSSVGLNNESNCTPCPEGWYCPTPGLPNAYKKCSAGHWCIERSIESSPNNQTYGVLCPKGYFCPEGIPIACPNGTYQPVDGRKNRDDCKDCDPGYYCGTTALYNMSGKCNAGFYCIGGATKPNPNDGFTGNICPAGSFCEEGSKWYSPCKNGTFTNFTASALCEVCPEGYMCTGQVAPDLCEQGYYCLKGTGYNKMPCPEGTYGSQKGLISIAQCTPCTAGSYCEGIGLPRPTGFCDPGYWCQSGVNKKNPKYGNHTGIGGECFLGHECKGNTSFPSPCPSGTFGNMLRTISCEICPDGKYCNGSTITPYDCPMGHYCMIGTQYSTQYKCPPGTFNNNTGSTSINACLLCPPGQYCQGYGRIVPNGWCSGGYFCKGGAMSANPGDLGTSINKSSSCFESQSCVCPDINLSKGNICPAGYFCPIGTSIPIICTRGMYCESEGLAYPTNNCSAGFYCIEGSVSSHQFECPVGHYCETGTKWPIPCEAGSYSNNTQNKKSSDCQRCTPGFYCDNSRHDKPAGQCAPRYYCPGGQSSPTPVGYECLAGHYCPQGSESPVPCLNGTYQNQSAQDSCLPCPEGFYCNHEDNAAASPMLCPAGHFCPRNTKYKYDFPCPKGTFSSNKGNARIEQCLACIGGNYCAFPGISTPTGQCKEGFYCYTGSQEAQPINHILATDWNFNFYNDICPKGYFCPNGTSTPTPCPRGYFSGDVGLKKLDECQPCPAGKYCNGTGIEALINPPNCSVGFVCVQGSDSPTPTGSDNLRGYPCRPGFYCPEGTYKELSCPPGTFQPLPQQGSCLACIAGSMCLDYNMTKPISCQPGYYCPGGKPLICPAGTYSGKLGLLSVDDCTDCPAGEYCLGGQSKPDGKCSAGFICGGGSDSSVPDASNSKFPKNGPCPIGKFCKAGTHFSEDCPAGYFRNTTGGTDVNDCFSCTPGWYCEKSGLGEPTGKCDAGWYCPEGQQKAQPSGNECKSGYYCPKGSAAPLDCETGTYQLESKKSVCHVCPPGYYCVNATSKLQKCDAHYYCPEKTKVPILCPNGTYSYDNETGLERDTDCRPCIAGHFCIMGTVREKCAAGYLCQSGSPSPTPKVPLSGPNTKAGPCPPGYFCSYGAIFPEPCPEGTFKPDYGGYGNKSDCWPCPAGKQCFGGNSTILQCPLGKYCEEGQPPTNCPINYYQNKFGSKALQDCLPCPAGYYCNISGMSDYSYSECPIGFYCLEGQGPQYCPPGTRRLIPGARNGSDCSPCPAKFYCPFKSENIYGTPCTSGFFCKIGSEIPIKCIEGYYCPELTGDPILCPGGFYCSNGTDTPKICEFPYYCPPGSSSPQICNLGYKALAISGNRTSHDIACMICPAGFYGNEISRLSCLECPEGYICPQGTEDPKKHVCPKGFYCPKASAEGIPCQPGMYGNHTKASKSSDCLPCPVNTFNNLKGMEACRPCGSSSTSIEGQLKCTCKGLHRSFQVSDGSCVCESGYVYYDVTNIKLVEGNSDKSCQKLVADRCQAGMLRDSNTLQCVDINLISSDYCVPLCGPDGGYFNVTDGRCSCKSYVMLNQVCNSSCLAVSPVVSIQRQISGVLYMTVSNSGNSTSIPIFNEYGINDFDYVLRKVEFAEFQNEGNFGFLPTTTEEVLSFVQDISLNKSVSRIRRSLDDFSAQQSIRSPVICVNVGQVVFFKININHLNRSSSNYPQYNKNHLFNTNPSFDYGQFRQLNMLIQATSLNINSFLNVFSEPGTYVFYDNAENRRETIVYVPDRGSYCPVRIEASTPLVLTKFGIGVKMSLNESPNWESIWIIIGLILIIVFVFVILAILWRPRAMGIVPISFLRSKYKSLGAPLLVVPLPGVNDAPDGYSADTPHVLYDEYTLPIQSGILENFNVRTLYDKLEDQTLHISSQIANHQSNLQGFYDRICQQTEGLKKMLDNIDGSVVTMGKENKLEETGQFKEHDSSKYTQSVATRQAELIKSLQALLDKYNGNIRPTSGSYGSWSRVTNEKDISLPVHATPMLYQNQSVDFPTYQNADIDSFDFSSNNNMKEKFTGALSWSGGLLNDPLMINANKLNKDGSPMTFSVGDYNNLINTIMAEKMILENALQEEENKIMNDFIENKNEERKNIMQKMAMRLAQQLAGVISPYEMQAIVDKHNEELLLFEERFNSDKEKQKEILLNDLKENRGKKLNALQWNHQQLALQHNIKLADIDMSPDIGVNLAIQQSTLEIAALNNSEMSSSAEASHETAESQEYASQMSKSFIKQMDGLISNKYLFADEAQDLIDQENAINAKLLKDMELQKASQLATFNEKLFKRKQAKLKELQDKNESERAQAVKEGKDLDALAKKHDLEREVLESKFATEQSEQTAEICKKLNSECKIAIRKGRQNLLNQLANNKGMDEKTAQALMDQLRSDNGDIMDNLEKLKQKNIEDVQAKINARKQRRFQEVKRNQEVETSHRLLSEQNILASQSYPLMEGGINFANVNQEESEEQKALLKEQQRMLDEIQERHQEEVESMENRLIQEQKEAEVNAIIEFEDYQERVIREAKNKQAAEVNARSNLSSEEMQQLFAAHNQQMENLLQALQEDKTKQSQSLHEKLEEKRKARLNALRKKQENQLARELLEQKKELADTERKAVIDAERQAILDAIRDIGNGSIESIIKKILDFRHAKEMMQLDALFAEEHKVKVDELLERLDSKHLCDIDELNAKHENELKELIVVTDDQEENDQLRAQLLNNQQIELKMLKKNHSDQKIAAKKNALADWELRYAKGKLDLKERHYTEYADYLSEFLTEGRESSLKKAQEAARELKDIQQKLEEQRRLDEEKLKKEMEEFEARENDRVQQELLQCDIEIEKEAEEERKKNEKAIEALNERKELLVKQKKKKAKEEVSKLIKEGASKEEQEALLKQHNEGIAKVINKMDADRLRMQGQLENRLQKIRKGRRDSKVKEVLNRSEQIKEELKEKIEDEVDKLNTEVAEKIKETLNIKALEESSNENSPNENFPLTPQLPTSYMMTMPLSDDAIINLLLQSPLYDKIRHIKEIVSKNSVQDSHNPKVPDPLSNEELVPVDLASINAREFVIYKFSCFVRDLLVVHCSHHPVDVLLAESLPSNNLITNNVYKNVFHYDVQNQILYLKRSKLGNVGDFILTLIHSLCHIHVRDIRNDSDPKFLSEFHKALSVVCSDLFLSRYQKSNALNKALNKVFENEYSEGQVLEKLFGDSHDEIARENVVNDLLNVKLVRSKYDSENFNEKVIYQRLCKYRDFIVDNKVRSLLGPIEEKFHDLKVQGSKTEIDRRIEQLNLQDTNVARNKTFLSRNVLLKNTRIMATARTPVALLNSVSSQNRGQPDGADEDFIETYLTSQIDELQEKLDEIDYEFAHLSREAVDLAHLIKALEGQVINENEAVRNLAPNCSERTHLTEILRVSNSKLSAARSQFTLVTVTKTERLDKLNKIKKELEEKKVALEEHQRKSSIKQ
nr:uncharacterized protein LOC100202447 isoform X1 [Hydra vulgaris]